MKSSATIILFTFLLGSKNATAQNNKVASIDSIISGLHKKHYFNGAIVAGQRGKIVFSKGLGYADFSDSLPFTPLTPSDGGSNAKTLTAAAILWLAGNGELTLNDSVQQYLPAYPYSGTNIFNLITHSTGGLPDYDYFFGKIKDTPVLTTPLMVKTLSNSRPLLPYPPNTNFHYDSPGFDLAAAVAEQISGLSYQEFLATKFFKPLNMQNSFVRPAQFSQWSGKRTKGYRYQKDTLKLFDIADGEGFYGGSNIWFSATDLYRWGTSFYHNPVLPGKIIKKLTSPVSINGRPSAVRLGAWYSGKNNDAFYYWGDLMGFYSWVYWDRKKKFTIAFVTNTRTPQWVRPQLTSALIDIMEGKRPQEIKEPQAELLEKEGLEKIRGFYDVNKYGNVEVLLRDGAAYLRLPTGMEYRMFQVDSKTFYVPGLEPWISFRHLKENKYQELFWSSTILQTTGYRIQH